VFAHAHAHITASRFLHGLLCQSHLNA